MKLPSPTRYIVYIDPVFDPFEDWIWYTVFNTYMDFPDVEDY